MTEDLFAAPSATRPVGHDLHPILACPICGVQFFAEQAGVRHPGQEHR